MRMGLVTFVVAAMLVPAAVAAAAPARVRVGVEGGWSYTGVSNSLFGRLFDEESAFQPAWSAGIAVDVPLAARFTLATGLRYVEYGEQVDVTFVTILPTDPPTPVPSGTLEIHNTWRYLAVPVRVKFRPVADRGLFVSLGPEIGYLLEMVNETEMDGQELATSASVPAARSARIAAAPAGQIFEQVGTFDQFKKFYNRWNLALAGGLGWEFPLWSHEAAVEVRYAEGVLDMAKSTSVTQRSRGLEAVLGLRW
jgi:hypothetical protein